MKRLPKVEDMSKFLPPANFNFTNPSEWPEWRDRFARFRLATKLNKDDGVVQVSALIYAMGGEAEHIYKSMSFDQTTDPKEDENDYETVLKKFDGHFVPRRNLIHERGEFYMRSQHPGEGVEQFLRSLYELCEHCEFEPLAKKKEEIRDRFVFGLTDADLRFKLQAVGRDLTLDKAVMMARQSELIKRQVSAQGDSVKHLQEVQKSGNTRGRRRTRPKKSGQSTDGQKCGRCGRGHAPGRDHCPANTAECRKCHKKGHYADLCRTKTVSETTCAASGNEQTFFLGAVTCSDDSEPAWRHTLKTQGGEINFKIDSGADVTIISETVLNKLKPKPKLQSIKTRLTSPGGQLACRGQFMAETPYRGEVFKYRVLVTAGDSTDNLLGRGVAVRMGLIQRLDEVQDIYGEVGRLQCKPAKITVRPEAVPYSVSTARRVPIPLLPQVEAELQRMQDLDVIERVQEASDWCAPMVAAFRKSGKIRICVDLRRLNESVVREKRSIPTLDDVLHRLGGSTVFSKLDAASGFWQIPLEESSRKLTTFITPSGRFRFKRLPFGITSAPEIFQDRMEELFSGVDGVEVIMDDILVHGKDMAEHDVRYENVLRIIRGSGLILNQGKCLLRQTHLVYMGNLIGKEGMKPDPEKVTAIKDMKAPSDVPELRRWLGMVNYLGRFLDQLSTILKPLNDLLKADVAWSWGPPQEDAFERVKAMVSDAPVLQYYDPTRPTVVSADASSYGLGGVLLQQTADGKMVPIAYCSRTLTAAETRYAQIEKELLASVWACEKFAKYLVGLKFSLHTDHKPLISIINKQDLDKAPVRCQRLLLRLMRFSATATYVPGKELLIADTLSRSPLECSETSDTQLDVEAYVDAVMENKPISTQKLEQIKAETANDPQLQTAIKYTKHGWPEHARGVPDDVQDLYGTRAELSVVDDMLILGTRIVIPASLRPDVLGKIHEGHLGINKCKERAQSAVWWPGIGRDIQRTVAECRFCQESRPTQRKEPLMTTPLPDRPWQRIAVDLCEQAGQRYLVVVDYFSRYIEVAHLTNMTSAQTIGKLKNMFAHWGIPDEVVSDNGTQFTSREFKDFADLYGFEHTTSSPHFPQSNGEVERAVQTAKKILKQPDPFLALMVYRATPVGPTKMSPCQLIMGRQIQTRLPTLTANLQPGWPDRETVQQNDQHAKESYRANFNRRHGVRPLQELRPGDHVLVKTDTDKTWSTPGTVTSEHGAPRSYIVQTPGGDFRRNRRHLQLVPEQQGAPPVMDIPGEVQPDIEPEDAMPASQPPPQPRPVEQPQQESPVTTTRSGRIVNKPMRYRDYM